jgi:hypothetical protein
MGEIVFYFRKSLRSSDYGVGPASTLLRSLIFSCFVFNSYVYRFQEIPGSTNLIEVVVALSLQQIPRYYLKLDDG